MPLQRVVGISCRTENANGKAQQDCGKLWQRFYQEKVLQRISTPILPNIFALYTAYEKDENAPYTYALGCAVETDALVPDGLQAFEIPGGIYHEVLTEGVMPGALIEGWTYIWMQPFARRYQTDFEIWPLDGQPGTSFQVPIYVG